MTVRARTESDGAAGRSVVSTLALAAVVLFVVAGVVGIAGNGDASQQDGSARRVSLADLTPVSTDTTTRRAPRDRDPEASTDGEVVHPRRTVTLHAAPGRAPFGRIGPRQMGPTWLPVVDRRGGWSQVLLPSRPNGSTGWLRTALVERRTTPFEIRVHLGSRELELFSSGRLQGRWPVAVGKPNTPTPTGRTFLLGSITDPDQSYSPVILPLGSHSDTLDTYGGGPGTVALHGWPDTSVFGTAASHGCVRVPAEALQQLTQVPLGTLVIVDEQ